MSGSHYAALWPDGRTLRCTVRAVRLDSVEAARAKLLAGVRVVVREGDADAVRGVWDGTPVVQD